MDKKHDDNMTREAAPADPDGILEVIFEHHVRDGSGDIIFRLTNERIARGLEVSPGDWVLLLTRVNRVRRDGGYLAGWLKRFKADNDPEKVISNFRPTYDAENGGPINCRLELSPSMAESYLLSIASSPVEAVTRAAELPMVQTFVAGDPAPAAVMRSGNAPQIDPSCGLYEDPSSGLYEVDISSVNFDTRWLRVEFSDGSRILFEPEFLWEQAHKLKKERKGSVDND